MSRAPNLTDTFARKVGEGMFGLLYWCEREKGLEWFEEGVSDKKYINERMVECVKELNAEGRFPKSMNFGWLMLARLLEFEQSKVSPLAPVSKFVSHKVYSPKGSMSIFGSSLLSLFRAASISNVYVHDIPDVFAIDYRLNVSFKDAVKVCKGAFTTKDEEGDYVTLAFSGLALNCWVWRRGDTLVSFTRFDPDNDDADGELDKVLTEHNGSESIKLALVRWLYCIRFGKAAPKSMGFDARKRLKSQGDLSSAWLRMQSREYTLPSDMKTFRPIERKEQGSWVVRRYGKDKILIDPVLPCLGLRDPG